MDEVSELTVRQISFLYGRDRDKEGKPRPLPYYFKDEETTKMEKIEYFRAFGKSLNKTDEEIEGLIQEAIKNGNI
jgi:transcription termination factor NusB